MLLRLELRSSCILLWVLHKVGVEQSGCGTDLGAFGTSKARHSLSAGCQAGNFGKTCKKVFVNCSPDRAQKGHKP